MKKKSLIERARLVLFRNRIRVRSKTDRNITAEFACSRENGTVYIEVDEACGITFEIAFEFDWEDMAREHLAANPDEETTPSDLDYEMTSLAKDIVRPYVSGLEVASGMYRFDVAREGKYLCFRFADDGSSSEGKLMEQLHQMLETTINRLGVWPIPTVHLLQAIPKSIKDGKKAKISLLSSR